jgi:hypothetical protein
LAPTLAGIRSSEKDAVPSVFCAAMPQANFGLPGSVTGDAPKSCGKIANVRWKSPQKFGHCFVEQLR